MADGESLRQPFFFFGLDFCPNWCYRMAFLLRETRVWCAWWPVVSHGITGIFLQNV
jgi:hypothetical protein